MKFPATPGVWTPTALLRLAAASVLATSGVAAASVPATAQAQLHNVKYTVFAEGPAYLKIYYRDVDPPNWADYSHNPYAYTPKVEADVGPNQQWNLDVQLANPDDWAMVVAQGEPGLTPNVHCILAVDGVVVATDQRPKGALCSIRNW
ncbi:hypothetical protein [Mycolicibacterium gadium]|jgi:hypothetical protein|uniref:Secreted protein n=1 Tax=Mycolicibacterium gadium TaxID=1794 RepID=A0ABT6GRX3_MYCGU|nr:hypothetical protein [Mycolicibacterium gadium]MDG5483988.1 hypothetical protein [Mycolicibacterium gadium]